MWLIVSHLSIFLKMNRRREGQWNMDTENDLYDTESDSSAQKPLLKLSGKGEDKTLYPEYRSPRLSRRRVKYLTWMVLVLLIIIVILVAAIFVLVIHHDSKFSVSVLSACNIDGQSCVGHRQKFKKGAVASDQPMCSEIGNVIMSKKGGNIVDAGIAVLICLGVANLQSAGVGGGGFYLFHQKSANKTHLVNARERAPLKAFRDMYKHDYDAAVNGGLAIAVPGEVAGYSELHSQFGKLPWKELFMPTIELCQNGFPIGSGLNLAIHNDRDVIFRYKGLKEILVNPRTGDVYKTGDIIKLPKLADTLMKIANGGAKEYYNGSLAKDIVDDIKDAGGIVSLEDLSSFVVESGEAMAIKLNDENTLHAVPPPSSGSLLGLIYNIMSDYQWRTDTLTCQKASVLFNHRLVEAWKYAYSIRHQLGDQDFVDVKAILKNVTSIDFAKYLRSQIDDDRTFEPKHYGPVGDPLDDHGTTHVSIMDNYGNAFAATTSINQYFGSKIVGKRTGILFDDTMDDFSVPNKTNRFNLPPSKENFIVPRKQPMSTMCPSIITDKDGDVVIVAGASGGSKILTATSSVVLRTMLLNDDLKNAIDATRIHHQWIPNYITYEFELEQYLYDGLKSRGHQMHEQPRSERGAVVQALIKEYIQAYCDVRKGGCPAGTN